MSFDILRIKLKHAIENGRARLSLWLSIVGLGQLSNKVQAKRQREIAAVLEAMTEEERQRLMSAKGQGHVALFKMYRDKYNVKL